jgi:hypothetical protein
VIVQKKPEGREDDDDKDLVAMFSDPGLMHPFHEHHDSDQPHGVDQPYHDSDAHDSDHAHDSDYGHPDFEP